MRRSLTTKTHYNQPQGGRRGFNGNLNFLQNIWSKFVVHGPDLFKDALKRPITTIPPSITTTHHDGSLPSPLSYTLANDDPSLPSMPTQHLQQNLREQHQFRNDGWTKWEALRLAGKLEAKRVMAKTVPPLITTTHHGGGLPSPLSYTPANDNPPLPSIPTQCLQQNLGARRQFRNDVWEKWEAVQLADKLEAKQAMEKVDWECWKKLEEGFEQFHGLFSFDLVDDNQEECPSR
jgi:hypothetical protein